jgi:4-hydroxy 2-oxovalerate aldolase
MADSFDLLLYPQQSQTQGATQKIRPRLRIMKYIPQMKFSILDCTIRDGGYYNAWDFKKSLVDSYIDATNNLPINYIEIGYRNNPQKEYLGKYAYTPLYELNNIKNKSSKKISIMLNEKDIKISDLSNLIAPIKEFIDMVRIAVDPINIDRAINLAKALKQFDLCIGFNVMYMSRWQAHKGLFDKFASLNDIVDTLYMVDSFGGVSPKEVIEILKQVKQMSSCKIGFHGHNNIELALINTLTAIENGVDFVDSTFMGMGRGAGNLKTELLLTYLNAHCGLEVDFNTLAKAVELFKKLHTQYDWGTNLPYMISGANSFPQKEVMVWATDRAYSFNSIVRALDNKKKNIMDNAKYPSFNADTFDIVIIIGGGHLAKNHCDGVKELINRIGYSVAIIHSTSRHLIDYEDALASHFLCLTGSEGDILMETFSSQLDSPGGQRCVCVLPPHPRKLGTSVPDFLKDRTFELKSVDFTKDYTESCTAIALQVAALLTTNKEIFVIGYDGYTDAELSSRREAESYKENTSLFSAFSAYYSKELTSLTPTYYPQMNVVSLYQKLDMGL